VASRKGGYRKSTPDRILIYLYDTPQGATATELSQELGIRIGTVRESCLRLKGEGFIVGQPYEEPKAINRTRAQVLWKVKEG
jgi:predicted ArsR family transcriptional regulator